MAVAKNRIVRFVLFILGLIFVAVGAIGVFIPLLPTTPFILLSAACFFKSSEKTHRWLYNHPLLGPPLKQWKEKGIISQKAKIYALGAMSFSLGIIWLRPIAFEVKVALSIILLSVSIFIITRPSK